nr:MAG: ORF1 [TTV-like mini virus]
MPWYYNWRNYWKRRRYTPRWRPRKIFRRKFWRRRRRRRRVRKYRKRKLRKLTIKEYQPKIIHKLKVTGLLPLFICTKDRVTNNLTQWLFSKTPERVPGLGGFSITQFTLGGLYELHQKVLNWWTKSNCTLPLIRYTGCKITLYAAENTDYVFRYTRCYPMKSSNLMYISAQPSMMMMNLHTIFMPCRSNNRYKKHKKTIRIPPPDQMTTKWYFQHDLTNIPLVATIASAASFDRYYLNSQSISNTIGFISLNTNIFKYHNFQNFDTTGYMPKQETYLYASLNGPENFQDIKIGDLIYLGNTGPLQPGTKLREIITSFTNTDKSKWDDYFTNKQHWGNPFKPEYFQQETRILYTNQSPERLKNVFNTMDDKISTNFQMFTDPFYYNCRYNPLDDTGKDSALYLVPNIRGQTEWEPLNNKNLILTGYPQWLMHFGWLDWQKQQSEVQQIDINYLSVFKSPYVTPKLNYYVVLDPNFLENTSPWQEKHHLTKSDETHFYPKGTFQLLTINNIGSSGPGIVKIPQGSSVEAHMKYQFYFKIGGCPAPMEKVCDPSDQPIYPIPNNMLRPNSLQNPETPPEYFLYNFDETQGQITKKAAERILSDWGTKESSLSTTGTTKLQLQPTTYERPPTPDQTSSSEEEEKTIQEQLNIQRRKQRLLKLKILQLMKLSKSSKLYTAE